MHEVAKLWIHKVAEGARIKCSSSVPTKWVSAK